MMSVAEVILLFAIIIMVYACVYSLVDRICKCIEHVNTAKAYNDWIKEIGGHGTSGTTESKKN